MRNATDAALLETRRSGREAARGSPPGWPRSSDEARAGSGPACRRRRRRRLRVIRFSPSARRSVSGRPRQNRLGAVLGVTLRAWSFPGRWRSSAPGRWVPVSRASLPTPAVAFVSARGAARRSTRLVNGSARRLRSFVRRRRPTPRSPAPTSSSRRSSRKSSRSATCSRAPRSCVSAGRDPRHEHVLAPARVACAALDRPERFAGLHWFNPPELVELVEVVGGERTATSRDGGAVELDGGAREGSRSRRARRAGLRRQPAPVRAPAGGIRAGRRAASARSRTSTVAVTHGLGARWAAIGPFEAMDLAGLDVHVGRRREPLARARSRRGAVAGDRPRLVESGALGT